MAFDLRDGRNQTVKHRLCRFEDIEDGHSRGFELQHEGTKTQLFVVRRGVVVFGYINECPHIGTPLNWKNTTFLTQDRSQIICATHGALFRIEDGRCTAGPCAGQSLTPAELQCEDKGIFMANTAIPTSD